MYDMPDFDLCLSLGNGAETVDLCRAGRNRFLSERDVLESDRRARYLRRAVFPGTNGLQGYLYKLTHSRGHVLPSVRVFQVQHMLLSTRLRNRAPERAQ